MKHWLAGILFFFSLVAYANDENNLTGSDDLISRNLF